MVADIQATSSIKNWQNSFHSKTTQWKCSDLHQLRATRILPIVGKTN